MHNSCLWNYSDRRSNLHVIHVNILVMMYTSSLVKAEHCVNLQKTIPKGRVQWRWSRALFSVVMCQDKWQLAQTGKQEVLSKHQEALLYHVCDGALAQVARRRCGTYLLGDLQNLPRQHPGQPALDIPAWAGGLDQMTSKLLSNLNHSVIICVLANYCISFGLSTAVSDWKLSVGSVLPPQACSSPFPI